ncbi:MAG: hypothetical protein AB1847_12245 [bacterium]
MESLLSSLAITVSAQSVVLLFTLSLTISISSAFFEKRKSPFSSKRAFAASSSRDCSSNTARQI